MTDSTSSAGSGALVNSPRRRSHRWWWVVGVVLLVIILALVVFFADLLGVRLIRRGSPRLNVYQGEQVTLELSNSSAVRKLEICVDQPTLFSGNFLGECRALKYFVAPNVTKAEVVIPRDFPQERAVVITRIRGADGDLLPLQPTDEKIGLWVLPGSGAPARQVSHGADGGSGGGGGGGSNGGGGGSGGDSGGGSDGGSSGGQTSSGAYLPVYVSSLCVDPSPYILAAHIYVADNTAAGFEVRKVGTSEWMPSRAQPRAWSPHSFYVVAPISTTESEPVSSDDPVLMPNTEYDVRFYGDPAHTYRIATGSVPTPAEAQQNNRRCADLPVLLHKESLPAEVTASNFTSGQFDNGDFYIRFTTSQPIFIQQATIQMRQPTAAWFSLGHETHLSLSPSFYRQSTEHTIRFVLGPNDPIITRNPGGSFEIWMTDDQGAVRGDTYSFTAPGGDGGVQISSDTVDKTTTGFLVRWSTNKPATSVVTSESGETVSFDEAVVEHAVPFVTDSNSSVFYDLSSTDPVTGTRAEVTDLVAGRWDQCTDNALKPTAIAEATPLWCLARVGVGSSDAMVGSTASAGTPWGVYCSSEIRTAPGRTCQLCEFPGGNFAAATCTAAPGDPAQY